MAILQYRLDGRMLHGQVSNFARSLNIDFFVVINEETSKDETAVMLLELAALSSEVEVMSPEDARDLLESDELEDYRVMVVFKEIFDAQKFVQCGYKNLNEIVVSGIFQNKSNTKEKCGPGLFVDDDDRKAFRYLESQEVILSYQIAPEYDKKKLKDVVKY